MWNHIAFIRIVKENIPFGLKIELIRLLVWCQSIFYVIFPKTFRQEKAMKRIYFLLSTDYSNLGDHAMSYAGMRFLKEIYPDHAITEITVNNTLKSLIYIKRIIGKEDIICLKGGGNIGVEYFREELIRRKIIRLFNSNRLIIFPQTAYFPDTKFGRKELENTVRIYNNHPRLLLFFRDQNSYDLLHDRIPSSYVVPDIVFTLDDSIRKGYDKSRISVCLRSDVEGIYSEEYRENVVKELEKRYGKVDVYDTIKPYYISNSDRMKELKNIWTSIERSKILVTDRLHGMIFAYLLHTPCVLLKTYNYKLTGQYRWIKKSSAVKMLDKDENLIKSVEEVMDKNDFSLDEIRIYFLKMSNELRSFK